MKPTDEIIMTVAQYEAKIAESFKRGRLHERDLQRLNYDHNMGNDRFKNSLSSVLDRLGIDTAKEEVKV